MPPPDGGTRDARQHLLFPTTQLSRTYNTPEAYQKHQASERYPQGWSWPSVGVVAEVLPGAATVIATFTKPGKAEGRPAQAAFWFGWRRWCSRGRVSLGQVARASEG
jgi:hypothetical protein